MHEKRNFVLILLLVVALVWAALAWLVFPEDIPLLLVQKIAATLLSITLLGWIVYAFNFEDKLPDHLSGVVGDMYYEVDGISFMPMVRVNDGQAELCVYYQNRFENIAEVVVHLRPPADSFVIRPGLSDVHFAFRCAGGDFGVIHQPIAVPPELQGEVIDVKLAAACRYPRSQGARWRKHQGMPCGSVLVDWGGGAFKTGVHESSNEMELQHPVTLHLSMPKRVNSELTTAHVWKQERIAAGAET